MSIIYDENGIQIRHTNKSIDELKRESYHHKSIDGDKKEHLECSVEESIDITESLFDAFLQCLTHVVGDKIKKIELELNVIRKFLINNDLSR